jgi:hypothetical protein
MRDYTKQLGWGIKKPKRFALIPLRGGAPAGRGGYSPKQNNHGPWSPKGRALAS